MRGSSSVWRAVLSLGSKPSAVAAFGRSGIGPRAAGRSGRPGPAFPASPAGFRPGLVPGCGCRLARRKAEHGVPVRFAANGVWCWSCTPRANRSGLTVRSRLQPCCRLSSCLLRCPVVTPTLPFPASDSGLRTPVGVAATRHLRFGPGAAGARFRHRTAISLLTLDGSGLRQGSMTSAMPPPPFRAGAGNLCQGFRILQSPDRALPSICAPAILADVRGTGPSVRSCRASFLSCCQASALDLRHIRCGSETDAGLRAISLWSRRWFVPRFGVAEPTWG